MYLDMHGLIFDVFPPWTITSLLRQPGHNELPHCDHIDAELSADARSTVKIKYYYTMKQDCNNFFYDEVNI